LIRLVNSAPMAHCEMGARGPIAAPGGAPGTVRRWAQAALWVAWLGLLPVLPAVGLDLPDTLLRVKPSVVGVGIFAPLRQPRSVFTGTGWVVADGLHVITNAHVVARRLDPRKQETLAVFVPGLEGREPHGYRADKVVCDQHHDLCLLRIQGASLPPLRLGEAADVREGQLYAMTGFPLGLILGLHPATHQGIVAAITPIAVPVLSDRQLTEQVLSHLSSPFEVFQLDAIAYPGNSGSPLYDVHTGKVVGVINSVFVKGSKENALEHPSGITYAIPVTYVYGLLRQAGLKP
jgi:S1-C subfamily serine protease